VLARQGHFFLLQPTFFFYLPLQQGQGQSAGKAESKRKYRLGKNVISGLGVAGGGGGGGGAEAGTKKEKKKRRRKGKELISRLASKLRLTVIHGIEHLGGGPKLRVVLF